MTLKDIESAVRPQFTWEPGPDTWKTDRHNEDGGSHVGMMIFVGLSTLHGFTREFICAKLNIPGKRFDVLWFRYQKYIKEAMASKFNSLVTDDEIIPSIRLYNKSKLVQNCLEINHGAEKINFMKLFKD